VSAARIERVVTAGTFSLDGGTWEVENNVWLYGDDEVVAVIDAAHDAVAIASAVAGRRVPFIVCTHGHDDHINAAVELSELTGAPVLLHPDDRMLWDVVHPDRAPDIDLGDDDELIISGRFGLRVLHTPGHSPGAVCLVGHGVVFSGDTLFQGGPGATGRSYSDFPTILESIRERLLVLPPETRVLTGHGDETTIGAEASSYDDWVARGQ
jgi:glyoxylase-like metal-dependent hydrolase (beta-lactamase superfamily II)